MFSSTSNLDCNITKQSVCGLMYIETASSNHFSCPSSATGSWIRYIMTAMDRPLWNGPLFLQNLYAKLPRSQRGPFHSHRLIARAMLAEFFFFNAVQMPYYHLTLGRIYIRQVFYSKGGQDKRKASIIEHNRFWHYGYALFHVKLI